MSWFYSVENNSLSVALFAIIFSHSEGYLFILLIVSFVVLISSCTEIILCETIFFLRGGVVDFCYVQLKRP